MNLKRVFTLTVAIGALAALIAGATTTGYRRAPIAPLHNSPPDKTERSSQALAVEIAKLHERLRPTVAPEQPARNLFEYRSSRATRIVAAEPDAPAVAAPVPVNVPPPLELIGLATDGAGATLVRTAIVSGFGRLFLVKEGEAVTERFRVTRIGADVVELSDTENSAPVRLALKR